MDTTRNSTTAALTPTIRKVIAEYLNPGWLVMDEAGDVTEEPTAANVLAAVKYADAKASRFQVTILEWRNVPGGFVAPEVAP